MTKRGLWLFPSVAASRLVAGAARAEAAGLDEYWLGDEGPARDPFGVLAAAAGVTQRIGLGIAITNPYLRHPMITAAQAMTVHELSGGRMTLALGPGGQLALGPAGVDRPHPVRAVTEAVKTVRAVASGRPGPGYQPGPEPFTQPDLKVYIGSRGRAFQRAASQVADGVFLGGIPLAVLDEVTALARSERDIELAFYIQLATTPAAAEELRSGLLWGLADSPAYIHQALDLDPARLGPAATALAAGDPAPALDLVTPAILEQYALVGSPAQAGAGLAALARRYGFTSVGISAVSPDPLAAVDAAAELFQAFDQQI
ncbi:MAG: LLM class flavin-dependent oxidoreductase [Bifidobacteriaceae bacterium]|nr:LLM class flavin-dependent oxidoreductase [Bifidobacteriaceae bacterium]